MLCSGLILRLRNYAKSDISDKGSFNSYPQNKCVKCLLDTFHVLKGLSTDSYLSRKPSSLFLEFLKLQTGGRMKHSLFTCSSSFPLASATSHCQQRCYGTEGPSLHCAVWNKCPYITTTVALETCSPAMSVEEICNSEDQLDLSLQSVLGGKQKVVPHGLHSIFHRHCAVNTLKTTMQSFPCVSGDTPQWSGCHNKAHFLGHWLPSSIC